MTTLENLYYGNLSPQEQCTPKNKQDALLKRLARYEEAFTATLTEAQKTPFETFINCDAEWHDRREWETFREGFRLGVQLMVEAISRQEDHLR